MNCTSKKNANVTEAIAAVEDAIAALQASKGEMTQAKMNSPQMQGVVSLLRRSSSKAAPGRMPNAQLALVMEFLQLMSSQEPAVVYQYRSNDIIAVLQNLLKTFKSTKYDMDMTEIDKRGAAEKKMLGLANEKTFKEKEKSEKQEVSDAKTEKLQQVQTQITDETAAMNADIEFRTELKDQCENKATEWDHRSKVRAGELTVIAEALADLKKGVAPNYDANSKLAGIQRNTSVQAVKVSSANHTHFVNKSAGVHQPHHSAQYVSSSSKLTNQTSKKAMSFFQVTASGSPKVVERMLNFLDTQSGRLQSPVLAAVAMKAALHGDHFVKVRSLIKDLIAKLQADALAEADSKSFCDTKMGEAMTKRDQTKLNMEAESTKITEKETEKAGLVKDIAQLTADIADLRKVLNEALELRSGEKATNMQTIADATAGKSAVDQAITVLEDFYAVSLAQYTPPKSDREGLTVTDRAPELSYSGDYRGKTEASTGIIGLLEVISSDFERTISTVDSSETDAQSKFETFANVTGESIAAKDKEMTDKESQVTSAESAIMEAKDKLLDAKTLHEESLSELEKLKAMCVEGAESQSVRREKREQEIEALKQALQILEEWQS